MDTPWRTQRIRLLSCGAYTFILLNAEWFGRNTKVQPAFPAERLHSVIYGTVRLKRGVIKSSMMVDPIVWDFYNTQTLPLLFLFTSGPFRHIPTICVRFVDRRKVFVIFFANRLAFLPFLVYDGSRYHAEVLALPVWSIHICLCCRPVYLTTIF